MSIVDPKGRIFGKINIIDFAIVLVVLFGAAVAVYLLAGHSKSGVYLQEAEIKIQPYQFWIFDTVKVGDVELNRSGDVVGEVIAKDYENTLVVAKVFLEPLKGTLRYQGSDVKVGYNMKLNTQEVFVDGIITDLSLVKNGAPVTANPDLLAEPVQVVANVRLNPPSDAIMNSIAPGDREIVLDGDKSTSIAEIVFKDPDRDVIAVKLTTLRLARGFAFRSKKLKVGSWIQITTQKAFIEGRVIDFREVSEEKTGVAVSGWRQKPVRVMAKIQPHQSQKWLFDSVVAGDKETASDGENRTVLAEIIKKEPEEGYLIARLHAQRVDDELTFRGKTIKIGSAIRITTHMAAIDGSIIDFKEEILEKNDDYFPGSIREPAQVVVKIKPLQLEPWLFDSMSVGDKETVRSDGKQMILAEILDIFLEEGTGIVQLQAEKGENGLEFKGASLKIGASIRINTPNVLIQATVTGLYEGDLENYADHIRASEQPMVERLITLFLWGKEPWFISSVKKGDIGITKRMGEPIKVAEIVQIDMRPSQVLVTGKGAPTWVDHPSKRDITLWVRAKGYLANGEFLYERQPIKIGRAVEIETQNTTIRGIVIDVESDKASIPPQ